MDRALGFEHDAHFLGFTRASSSGKASPLCPPNVCLPTCRHGQLAEGGQQGDPAAQFCSGARYATGEEVEQDYTEDGALGSLTKGGWSRDTPGAGHLWAPTTGRAGGAAGLTKAYYWSVLAQAGGDQASKYRVCRYFMHEPGPGTAAHSRLNDWVGNFAGHAPPTP